MKSIFEPISTAVPFCQYMDEIYMILRVLEVEQNHCREYPQQRLFLPSVALLFTLPTRSL